MIRVTQKAEYLDFNNEVRRPGSEYLAVVPSPTSKQFSKKNYWKHALKELHAAYSGVCAYTSMYLPDRGSVDHFLPKSSHPQLAYEWSNYRLANSRVNSSKGNSLEVLDPFQINDGWFQLDLPSCLIKADPELPRETRVRINATINTLRLNSDDTYVEQRCRILISYARGQIGPQFLEDNYPFLQKEIVRQGIQDRLSDIFKL